MKTQYKLNYGETILKIERGFFGSSIGLTPEKVKSSVENIHLKFKHFSKFLGFHEYEDSFDIVLFFESKELGEIKITLMENAYNRIEYNDIVLVIFTETFYDKVVFLSRILNHENLIKILKIYLNYEYDMIEGLFNKIYTETTLNQQTRQKSYFECETKCIDKITEMLTKPKINNVSPSRKEINEYLELMDTYELNIRIFSDVENTKLIIMNYFIEPLLNNKFDDILILDNRKNKLKVIKNILPSVFNYNAVLSYLIKFDDIEEKLNNLIENNHRIFFQYCLREV